MARSSCFGWRRNNATVQLYCRNGLSSLAFAGSRAAGYCVSRVAWNEELGVLMHRVLLLGAGKIGRMIARFLMDSGDYEVLVGDVNTMALDRIAKLTGA